MSSRLTGNAKKATLLTAALGARVLATVSAWTSDFEAAEANATRVGVRTIRVDVVENPARFVADEAPAFEDPQLMNVKQRHSIQLRR